MAIISDIARGRIAELKFARDCNDAMYSAARECIGASLAQLNAFQSLLRIQKEIGE
jgi:hypothetical protein